MVIHREEKPAVEKIDSKLAVLSFMPKEQILFFELLDRFRQCFFIIRSQVFRVADAVQNFRTAGIEERKEFFFETTYVLNRNIVQVAFNNRV